MEGIPARSGAATEPAARRPSERTGNPERMRQHLHHIAVKRRLQGAVRPPAAATAPPERWQPGRGLVNAHVAQWLLALPEATRPRVPVAVSLACVAHAYEVDVGLIVSQDRRAVAVAPRQVAMLVARRVGRQSTLEIGAAMGGRDHSTVTHGSCKMAALMARDERFAARIGAIELAAMREWDARNLAVLSYRGGEERREGVP